MNVLPVVSFYAALSGLLLLVLSMLVIRARVAARVGIGLGEDIRLLRASRAQGNFVEYAPMSLILLALLEATGSGGLVLHGLGALALAGRLAHALSISREPDIMPLRQLGMALTFGVLAVASLMLLGRALLG